MGQIATETMRFPFANFVDYEVINIDNQRKLIILSVETKNGQIEYALHSFLLTRNILRWRGRRVLS
jgi:hypothetical protein